MRLWLLIPLLLCGCAAPKRSISVEAPSLPSNDPYEKRIQSLVSNLESKDFMVREKSYRELCEQPWDKMETYLPREGPVNTMWYLKMVERTSNVEMRIWFNDYAHSVLSRKEFNGKPIDDWTLNPSFSQNKALSRPHSIFARPKDEDIVKPWPKKLPDFYFEQGRWHTVCPEPLK